jgi:hypothetical protein
MPSPGGTTLNTTGPQIFPPENSTIPTNKSVGPFTGGTSTENAPGGGSSFDPRNWFKADPNATFQEGQPMNGPGGPAAGGGFNPLAMLGGGNPYWRGIIAGGGVLTPTPAETGEFTPSEPNFVRPDAPMSGVHGLPAPSTPSTPPYPPPRPANLGGRVGQKTRINPGSVNLGHGVPGTTMSQTPQPAANSPFTTLDYRPNSGPNERNRGSPVGTALDLSGLFNHPAVAAAAAAHPAVQAHVAAQVNPRMRAQVPGALASGPMDPSIIARQRMAGPGVVDPSIVARQRQRGITP